MGAIWCFCGECEVRVLLCHHLESELSRQSYLNMIHEREFEYIYKGITESVRVSFQRSSFLVFQSIVEGSASLAGYLVFYINLYLITSLCIFRIFIVF